MGLDAITDLRIRQKPTSRICLTGIFAGLPLLETLDGRRQLLHANQIGSWFDGFEGGRHTGKPIRVGWQRHRFDRRGRA